MFLQLPHTPVKKGNRKIAPVGLNGVCFLLLTDVVFKLRSPQLGCGHSLETQLQILASAHPWLLASRGISKEAGLQTRTQCRFTEHREKRTMVSSPGADKRFHGLGDIIVRGGEGVSGTCQNVSICYRFMCLNTRCPVMVLVWEVVEPFGHGTKSWQTGL